MNNISTGNPTKDNVYNRLLDLMDAVERDGFNLSRNQQDLLLFKLNSFKAILDEEYGKCSVIN